MRLDEILHEMDAYLSRLRQARELLLDQRTEAALKRVLVAEGRSRLGRRIQHLPAAAELPKINADQIIPSFISIEGRSEWKLAPRFRSPQRSMPQIWSSRRFLRRNAPYPSVSL